MADLATRRLVPEMLDELPPEDPAARRSRGDLARLNALMAHGGIMAKLLRDGLPSPPRRLLEIGAGDGRFALALARRFSWRWPGVEVTLLDRQDLATPKCVAAFEKLGWRARFLTEDVFVFAERTDERFDAVYANLFLHHFEGEALLRLLRLVAPLAPVFAACEPRRAAFPLTASRLLLAIGANRVTRHDAPASVRAGFRGDEISRAWPPGEGWTLAEAPRGLFTQGFLARRGDARP